MAMEYGATGKILRKTQNNQWRKADGDWNSDAETTVDYRYAYDGQKPHAVSSITDGVTETLHTFTYDASGNNLLETNSKASSDRQMVWTEDNRLASIKARGNISHYLYDANGIRTLKMSSSSFNISINGVAAGSSAVDGNFTIYANPYAVVRKNQYTKHYFLGTQRILTKIGSNSVEKTFYEGNANAQVESADYEGKQSDLEGKITLNNKLLNVGWYRETRGRVPSPYIKHYLRAKEHGGLSGVNPWADSAESGDDNGSNQTVEDKQYYFHPDHLGSTNYLTDVTGEAYQHVAYLPWGEVFVEQRNTQSGRNTFLYTGKELDEETGLYYYEQRYYDPNKSTFLGVDPIAEERSWVSPYNFVQNNPINRIDPTGMLDDHWEIDENGNATLVDTEGDEIYINDQLITKYKFDTQEKLDALSEIGGYYYNQNNGSSDLLNAKVSVLSYENYKLTGSSNWELESKPYNLEVPPMAFSYSKKQFGTDVDRVALTVDNGYLSSSLSTKWNMRNALYHENIHTKQPLDVYNYKTYAPYFELAAYKGQMQHSTWNKTTSGFQSYMLGNTESYLNRLKGSNNAETQKAYQGYLNFFNTKR